MNSSPLLQLSLDDLREVAEEMRQTILATCLKNGGHLGASLGTVEIALALHRCFRSPDEPIIWDVGHQAYAHKLLTGRAGRFETLRTTGGISGFLSREESPHDVYGAGHSSTSISAAMAMAWVRVSDPEEARRWTIAVIGDGGLTAGLALEALNNLRAQPLGPLLILLNDNQMSISPNVGAIPAILSGGRAKEFFNAFEVDYIGPVDGHDLATLIGTLEHLKAQPPGRPVVVHVLTQKGKGYLPAEERPAFYHGISPISVKVPEKSGLQPSPSYSHIFGESLCELAQRRSDIVAITAAMPEGTGLTRFSHDFASRFFDVGIAEPHAVVFAAGLATQGVRPVVAIYSTFLQRGLDGIIHDVALQNLPVVFAIDRAGLVGADGPTHHGAFDLAYLGLIPNLTIYCPSSLKDVSTLLEAALSLAGPSAIRYPRGSGPEDCEEPLIDGVRWHRLAEEPETEVIAVALGSSLSKAQQILQELEPHELARCTLISCVQAKPIPASLIEKLRSRPKSKVIVLEEGVTRGGFGQALIAEAGPRTGAWQLAGYPDAFVTHGSVSALEDQIHLSVQALSARLRELLA